jgi:hypothetical protein
MQEAVDENDYETFFEYRMDQYSRSGVVGRDATKSTAKLGERLFRMVVDALVPMVKRGLNEDTPESNKTLYENQSNKKKTKTKHISSGVKRNNIKKYSRNVEDSTRWNVK